jgi:hypothetical protein
VNGPVPLPLVDDPYVWPREPGVFQQTADHATRHEELPQRGWSPAVLAAFSGISPHFRPRRHLMTASDHRAELTVRFALWEQITGTAGRPTTA